ncbi:MAG: helix-turn-helix transcriptional regulator [Ectothiorhodospiraceae bacterium AqS1]|nr:helix-turn-helix transcriptional regulator [Ectothiorhodospiraceae bacterium AqS1]
MSEQIWNQHIDSVVARLRAEANITPGQLAKKSNIDESRISQIEMGEFQSNADVDRVVRALDMLKSSNAKAFKQYIGRKWNHIEPPSFWNPERECLETTEDTLEDIAKFIEQEDRPWPLRRLIERHRDRLVRSAMFLGRLDHNIAFIGDIGAGKSTAISFIFDLLVPLSSSKKSKKEKKKIDQPVIDRPVLETGGGGTTICEVQIKNGPEIGISLLPMSDAEMRDLVSDFCAAKWSARKNEVNETGDKINVSSEHGRAIRNMSGLGGRNSIVDGKLVGPVIDLVNSSDSEDDLRAQILELMNLEGRTRCKLQYDRSTHPMEWIKKTFRAVNNGRLEDVSLPKSINLLIPNFGQEFGDLDIAVIDTKGVDDNAVREDLDRRLKDPRTAVVFCSTFNDAPGNSTLGLLDHMRETFSEDIDNGKVSLLILPRSGEARAMKDDAGNLAKDDNEGYDFKHIQILPKFEAKNLNDTPMLFYNAEVDDATEICKGLFEQLSKMRKAVEERLLDLCVASKDIIENHEAQALSAAIEEVANRLNIFLKANRSLGAREKLAHVDAISIIKNHVHPSTLWASTRRDGDYMGLSVVHLIGVGAARDANRRSESWFNGFDAFIKSLKADKGLELANRSIKQIAASAAASRKAFLEEVQRGAVDVYEEPLSQASVWSDCASEWGRGSGFRERVANHLDDWFSEKTDLKDRLERKINKSWDKVVIEPLKMLSQEA